eukprot:163221_1
MITLQIIYLFVLLIMSNEINSVDDQKSRDDVSDDEYEQESIVHANGDLRQAIYEFNHKRESIVKCIGQLRCEYNYIQHHYIKHKPGTATAFNIDIDTKTVYAITCAHNVRHRILECAKCKYWMELRINRQKVTSCINATCNGTQNDLSIKMIKSTGIQFKQRSIKKNEYEQEINDEKEKYKFGDTIMAYNTECKLIDDTMYEKYWKTYEGYDIALLSFVIDNNDQYSYQYYLQHTKNIAIDNGTETLNKIKTFHIFGYPYSKAIPENDVYRMFGQQSSQNNNYEIIECKETNQMYLQQKEIDTSHGQSGSVIWVKNQDNNTTIIVGIHTGGNPKKRYNVATLISDDFLCYISENTNALRNDAILSETKLETIRKYRQRRFNIMNSIPGKVQRVLQKISKREDAHRLQDICNAVPVDGNLFHWKGTIYGPVESVYEGGTFLLDIRIGNDFPLYPPSIIFTTKIYHCNIDCEGYICLDVLSERYTPALCPLSKILLSIQQLLQDPNPDDPLCPEIARLYKTNREKHDAIAKQWTHKFAT